MLKIGDKVHKALTALYTDGPSAAKGTARPKFWGTVVWIHPAGRFYLAAFPVMGGTVRECFPLPAGGRQ